MLKQTQSRESLCRDVRCVALLIILCGRVCPSHIAAQDASLDQFFDQLRSPNPQIQTRAADAIANSRDLRAIDPLIAALSVPDHNLATAAAYALRTFWDPRVNTAFISVLQNSSDPELQIIAAKALAVRREPSAVESLIPLLASSDTSVDQAAIEALAMIDTPKAVDALIVAYKKPYDSTPRSDSELAIGLATTKDSRVIEALVAALRNPEKRENASYALSQIGQPAVMPLLALLDDPDPGVRAIAVFATNHSELKVDLENVRKSWTSGLSKMRVAGRR